MKNILMLHGVNHNMYGHRNPKFYGTDTLEDINAAMLKEADEIGGLKIEFFQSNHEGDWVDKINEAYFKKTGRRITYEYALIDGYNDRDEDIIGLITLLKGSQNHLNLIGLNEVPGTAFKESSRLNYFMNELEKQGINVTLRRKMGREIDAACGQLRKKRDEDKVSL